MQRPHIAMLLTNGFRPDPRVLKEARTLATAGYRVTVVCWDREGALPARAECDGFEVRRIQSIRTQYSAGSRQALYLPRFWQAALHQLQQIQPNIVHCHDLDTTPAGYWYARTHRIPWIYDAHECYPEQIRPQVHPALYHLLCALDRFITRRATCVITVGELLAQRFRDLRAKQVAIVGNYQPLANFRKPTQITRRELGIDPQDLIVSYIGGFTLARALIPWIEAAALVPNVTLLLGGDGPQRPAIEAILPDHPNVRDLGWVPAEQIANYVDLSDLLYYGLYAQNINNQYSTPNALFTAMAAGKPLLTTNVGEVAQIVRKQKCGLVVNEPTPQQIAAALEQLATDVELRTTMSQRAKQLGETVYNWKAAESVLLATYAGLG